MRSQRPNVIGPYTIRQGIQFIFGTEKLSGCADFTFSLLPQNSSTIAKSACRLEIELTRERRTCNSYAFSYDLFPSYIEL